MVGSFAPGHLGELTQHLSFEMVDAACEETDIEQKRVRDLPSRVVVYLPLAACLFPDAGYQGVWRKLTAGLHAPAPAAPAGSALAQARRRIGPAPLRWLFELLRAPAGATPGRNGVWFKGLLVTAIDSTILTVPDTGAVRTRFTKQAGNHGGTGYPHLNVTSGGPPTGHEHLRHEMRSLRCVDRPGINFQPNDAGSRRRRWFSARTSVDEPE